MKPMPPGTARHGRKGMGPPSGGAVDRDLPGAEVEDTFPITEHGPEVLTGDPEWSMVQVEGRGRPDILGS